MIYDVAVVGAGLSGLIAAAELQKSDPTLKVVIFEGRDRLGGRIYTKNGIDLGASWIHGHIKNPIYEIATAHKLDLKPTNWDNTQLYDSRGEVSDKEEVSMENMWRKIQKGINQRKNALRKSADGSLTSLSQVVDESIKEMGVTMESKEMKWIRFMLSAEIENEFAADASELSAINYDEGDDVKGNEFLFCNGYQEIIDIVAASVTCPIHLKTVVTDINYTIDEGEVEITALDEASCSKVTFRCRSALVTVPLGVLKSPSSLTFTPPLPEKIQDAVKVLGMGVLNKYVFEFPPSATMIPKKYDAFGYVDEELYFPEMINWSKIDTIKRGGNYVLVIFSAGSKAREMSKLSDEELQIKLMVQLRHMFPKLPSPLSFTCTRWDQDPFTLGSYSYLATGASPTHRMAFHTPLVNKASQPRVWFAGEHTIVQCPAMTHGAYLSGVRAARDILSYRTLMKK